MKTKKVKKLTALIFALFLASLMMLLSFAGCKKTPEDHSGSINTPKPAETAENTLTASTQEPSVTDSPEPVETTPPAVYYDDAAWYSPLQHAESPAKVINIATGEVLVACPDPLCNHSGGSDTCFFNTVNDDTMVFCAEYLNGHIYFIADKATDDGHSMKLYDFDIINNRIDEVYKFSVVQSNARLYKNSHTLFFAGVSDAEEGDADDLRINLFSYDPETKAIALIDDNARYALSPTDVVFFDDYYIRSDGSSEDEDGSHFWYCRCSYDGKTIERYDSLSDGTPFSPMGWDLKPSGVFANTWGNGGMYLTEDDIKLDFPTDSATTAPVGCNGVYYFQTRSSGFVDLGKNPYTGAIQKGYAYDNEIYAMNKDGSYKHYTIDCKYHFVINAIYENIIVGRVTYMIPGAGQCINTSDSDTYILPDAIRIDLETGETNVYDTSRRNRFEVESFVSGITLNEN